MNTVRAKGGPEYGHFLIHRGGDVLKTDQSFHDPELPKLLIPHQLCLQDFSEDKLILHSLQEEATSEVPKAEVVTSPAAVDHNSGEEENAVESQPAHKPGQKPTKQYALKRYMKPDYFCYIYWSRKHIYFR